MGKLSYRLTSLLAAIIFVVVPFHAFLTVWASTLFGHFEILRLWDNVLLLILFCITGWWLIKDEALRRKVFTSILVRLIIAYIVIILLFGFIALIDHNVTIKAFAYSLLVNTRFLVWFIIVWIISTKSDYLQRNWKKLIFWPLTLVALFGILQFFVLPPDFLTHFGYNVNKTFIPIITINQNTSTIRIQSFLRGTNELGAYIVIILSLLLAYIINKWHKDKWQLILLPISLLVLLLTFSRSAWIGAVAAIALVLWLGFKSPKYHKLAVYGALVVIVLIGISLVVLKDNHGVEDALLHVSTSSTAKQTSNFGHESALQNGVKDLVHQPFGRGPGTAGPASFYNAPHAYRNSESYILEIAEETGWIGLIFFVSINLVLGIQLLKKRSDPLAIGLFAALVGLTLVNLLSYAWADDTVAFIFWGLAGIALSDHSSKQKKI